MSVTYYVALPFVAARRGQFLAKLRRLPTRPRQ